MLAQDKTCTVKREGVYNDEEEGVLLVPTSSASTATTTTSHQLQQVLKFEPALKIQRKMFIADYLKQYFLNRQQQQPSEEPCSLNVLDIGCGQGELLTFLREDIDNKWLHYGRLDGLDCDVTSLESALYHIRPSMCHYLQPFHSKCTMTLYNENVIQLMKHQSAGAHHVRERFACEYDAVVCTEVIEHVHLGQELQCFEQLIFCELLPEIVIITTPNREFNYWFQFGNPCSFRHSDHKFEWTRQEFEIWTRQMIQLSNHKYQVEITGVGEGPSGDMSLGYATQIAVFTREASCSPNPISFSKSFSNDLNTFTTVEYPVMPKYNDESLIRDECVFAYTQLCYLASLSAMVDDNSEESGMTIHSVFQYLQTRMSEKPVMSVLSDKGIHSAEQLAKFLQDHFPDDFEWSKSDQNHQLWCTLIRPTYHSNTSEEEEFTEEEQEDEEVDSDENGTNDQTNMECALDQNGKTEETKCEWEPASCPSCPSCGSSIGVAIYNDTYFFSSP